MREPVLVEVPCLYPAATVDGRQDGPVADTFIELPGYGEVYLSRNMVRDCARLFPGLVRELALEQDYVAGDVHAAMIQNRDEQIDAQQHEIDELSRIAIKTVKRAAALAAAEEGA